MSDTRNDSWGAPAGARLATSTQRRALPVSDSVRDDWDDEEEAEEEDPQQLWEEANKRAPMPELVISGSSTSGNATVSPPPAAFQPVLRILKRPTASSSSVSPTPSSSSDSQVSTYAEREARYQAARERIFGDTDSSPGSPDPSNPNTNGAEKTSPPSVQIAREPKGPPAQDGSISPSGKGQDEDFRGFRNRRGKRRGVY
ncbi:hypothetical protein C8Q74DRAFT_1278994 [Fomes fomentarius]|nr:hypothetical protein C8Q74DRAFT_1278994 [Fomes fomentarius]